MFLALHIHCHLWWSGEAGHERVATGVETKLNRVACLRITWGHGRSFGTQRSPLSTAGHHGELTVHTLFQRARSFPDGASCLFFKVRRCTFECPFGDVDSPHAGHDAANVDQDGPLQIIPQWGKLLFFSKRRHAMPLLMLIAPMQVIAWQCRGETNCGRWALSCSRGDLNHCYPL